MTADKDPRQKMSASLQAMAPFFEASLDGIVVVDDRRRYLYVNPAAEEIFGEKREDLLGRDFLRTFSERMHETMLGYFGSTLSGSPGLWETTIQRPDGTERELQFSNLEFELEGEKLVGAILRDLTDERRRARETEATSQVAATFTLDRPLEEALTSLCAIVRNNSTAVACSAVLLDETGRVRLVGNVGQPPGYLEAMRQVWAERPPGMTVRYLETPEPSYLEGGKQQLLDNDEYRPAHPFIQIAPWDDILFVPMAYQGRVVGALNAFYPASQRPVDSEVHLIKAIANQAAVAVENSRLLERERQHSDQLAALLNSSAAVASTFDLDAVMDSVVDQVASLVEHSGVSLILLDGDDLVIRKSRLADGEPGSMEDVRVRIDRETELWSAFLRGETIILSDLQGDTQRAREMRATLGERLESQFAYVRSWMAVPLRAHGKILGALTVSRATPGYFTDDHEQLLTGLANHAASGIERARLFEDAERAAAETAALVRVAGAMTFDDSPEHVLDVLAENVVAVTGAVSCAVMILDPAGQRVELAGTHNLAPGYLDAIATIWQSGAFSPTLLAFHSREVQVVPNVTGVTLADERFAPIHDFVRDTPWNTMVALPLIYRSEAVGTMTVYFVGDVVPTDRQLGYLKALADQAALAGANLSLFAEAERRRRRAEALARVASAMTFHETPRAVLDLLAENVLSVTSATSAGIILTDESGRHITEVGSANLPDGYIDAIKTMWEEGTRIVGFESIDTGQVVVAHDLPAITRGIEPLEAFREFADQHWHTLVAVPLIYRGTSVGSLNVLFSRESLPDDEDMAMLRALSDQAALTAANLRLFAESEQRRRRAETLALVAATLTERRSIEETLAALTEVVVHTTSAVGSSVMLVDETHGTFTLGGSYGLPDGFNRVIREAWREGRTTMMTRALELQEPRVTRRGKQRFLADPDYAEAWEAVRNEPWEPVALLPMIYRGRPVGLLGTFHLPDDIPDEEDLSLLTAVADQAAIAVENRRLFVETERRLRQLEAVAKIAADLTVDQPVDVMMCSLAENVVQSTGAIACSVIRVNEGATVPLQIMAQAGLPEGYQQALQEAYNAGAPSAVMNAYREREAMIVHNWRAVTLQDERFAAARALVEDEPWDCVGVIPIVYRDEALGLLLGYYPARTEPSNEEMAYLAAIADQAAIAITNARLSESAQESAAVGERQRLARELHDSVSQALYGIALGARTARTLLDRQPDKATEPVEYVLQLAQAGLAEMRALIFELRPESLAQEGIVAALDKQVAATTVRYGLNVEADLGEEPPVPLDVKEAAYRIGQEALHNIVKHAKASNVRITLSYRDHVVSLDIADDGVGFDPDGDFPGHLGLRSMRERAARVAGTLDFTSAPGNGTTIRLRIPVPQTAEPHMPAVLAKSPEI